MPLIQGAFDRFATTLTGAWMPWLGKSFDAAADRGYNRLAPSARWPAKLLWPFYSTTDDEDARHAFDFETAIEPGKADPDVQVLKIDYGPVESNPGLVIRRIRDELVEIVPDTYLGKILWRSGEGDDATYSCIGYFALRQPAVRRRPAAALRAASPGPSRRRRRGARGMPAASASAASTSARIARSEREATSGSARPSTWT